MEDLSDSVFFLWGEKTIHKWYVSGFRERSGCAKARCLHSAAEKPHINRVTLRGRQRKNAWKIEYEQSYAKKLPSCHDMMT